MQFSFRAAWYAATLWILAFLASGIVVVPWFYIILPLLILGATVYYLDDKRIKKAQKKERDLILKYSLAVSVFWFLVALILSTLELVGLYYFDLSFYFSDFKNILLFPLVLIVPLIYGIMLSNVRPKRGRKPKKSHFRFESLVRL